MGANNAPHEIPQTFSQMDLAFVMTLLLLRQDADALDVALQANAIDGRNAYVRSSLILAYHFNDRKADRDALIKKASKEATDSGDQKMVQYALDVMAKKEKFRNY